MSRLPLYQQLIMCAMVTFEKCKYDKNNPMSKERTRKRNCIINIHPVFHNKTIITNNCANSIFDYKLITLGESRSKT